MRKIAVFIFFVFVFSGYSKDVSWYKYMEGKIGEYPVIMHLHKYGEQVSGYYYYEKFRQPMYILGNFTGDSLSIFAYLNAPDGEYFRGVLKGDSYKGEWNNDKQKLKYSLKENKVKSIMFEYVYVQGNEMLFKDLKDISPTAGYLEASIWPAERNPDYKFINQSICLAKGYPGTVISIGGEMLANKKKFMEDFREQNKSVTKKEIEDAGYGNSYSMEEQDNMDIAFWDDRLLVLSRFSYMYSGGAHGNYATGYYNYDLVNKKELKLKDIISDDGIKALPKILEANFRKQNAVPENQTLSEFGLFTDTIHVTENICFTPGCMMFDYVPYEIGPYAAGELRIYVPIHEIEKYLSDRVKKLLL